ncbi:MAG TPA: membrane protein insertase YidC [Burkholderiales bacterium]|nr:membrane protein insertase YidC [Burkholderiales bacterium]
MDNQRLFLFFALALILMLLWQAWEQEHRPVPTPVVAVDPAVANKEIPPPPVAGAPKAGAPARLETIERGRRIKVVTDTFEVYLDTYGGDLREAYLRKYPVSAGTPDKPFPLLSDAGNTLFVAQSGLIGHEGSFPHHRTLFQAAADNYVLGSGQDELRVPLTWRAPDGVLYTKTYIFKRDNYVVGVEFRIDNRTRREWRGYFYGQLQRTHTDQGYSVFALPTYTGGAIYTPEEKYQKISFDDMTKKPLKRDSTGGWTAMLQHYFVGSWMLAKDERGAFYTDVLNGARYVIGYKQSQPTTVAPGASGTLRASLYVGPKEQQRLKPLAEGMDLTVDYGWLTVLAAPLFWLLEWLHRFLGNWGWAIIVLTILIKAAFYPLSAASYKSMAHMKKVQPRLVALKERYGDDKQKLNQAMMEMYKTEKINPLGGCLPILVQIPVFIALYWVLLESVEMRHAPWILWIKDLSAQDPYYILPVIMGVSMYAQQFMNPQPLDPIQKKVFMFMPLMFTVFFLFFPAGLVLYWVVNNILSIAQQWQINRSIGVAAH